MVTRVEKFGNIARELMDIARTTATGPMGVEKFGVMIVTVLICCKLVTRVEKFCNVATENMELAKKVTTGGEKFAGVAATLLMAVWKFIDSLHFW